MTLADKFNVTKESKLEKNLTLADIFNVTKKSKLEKNTSRALNEVFNADAKTQSKPMSIVLQDSFLEYSWEPETKMVTFVATVPNNNYFAIGFGTSMRNTDMILWQAIGEKSVTTDLWSTSYGRPATDSN